MAVPSASNEAEQYVEACCREGVVANFQARTPKNIGAAFLRRLVLARCGDVTVAPAGFAIHGAIIDGALDFRRLASASTPLPILDLSDCEINGDLNLDDSCWTSIIVDRCSVGGLSGRNLHLEGSLSANDLLLSGNAVVFFDGLQTGGSVNLQRLGRAKSTEKLEPSVTLRASGSRIGGYFSLEGARLFAAKGAALFLDRAAVAGDLFLRSPDGGDRFEVTGTIRMLGIKVSGQVNCTGARIQAHAGDDAIILERADVTGHVLLYAQPAKDGHRFEVTGAVRLSGIKVGGHVSCFGAKFNAHPGDAALFLDGAEITGNVFLAAQTGKDGHRFEATGEVRLLGARVGGQVNCIGARLEAHPGGDALSLDTAEVDGSVILRAQDDVDGHRFEAIGTVRLLGAKVRGQVSCIGAKFEAQMGNNALSLERAEVTGHVLLRSQDRKNGHRFEARGTVRLSSLRAGGQVDCMGAKFEAYAGYDALTLEHAEIADHVLLRSQLDGGHRLEAKGTIRLFGIKVGGQVNCVGARLEAHRGGDSLSLERAEVTGHVLLNSQNGESGYRFDVSGTARLQTMKVGGQVSCIGAKFDAATGSSALSMNGAEISGNLLLRAQDSSEGPHCFEAIGAVQLTGVRVAGSLTLAGARLKANGNALQGENMHVADALLMCGFGRHRFECDGTIRLSDTEIGGNLDCSGAILNGANGRSLSMARGRIGGDVLLCASDKERPFVARGEVRFAGGTTIRGRLDCAGASLLHGQATAKRALALWNLTIERDLQLRPAFGHRTYVEGRVYAYGLKVGGTLECVGLFANHPEGDALVLDSASIGSDLLLSSGDGYPTDIRGSISLSDSRIGGSLRCEGVRLGSSQMDSRLDLSRTSVTGAVVVRFDGEYTDACIRLVGARAGELDDDGGAGWGEPPSYKSDGRGLRGTLLELDGFTYDRLSAAALPRRSMVDNWRKRVAWLERQFPGETPDPHHFFPQPHEQLARALRLAGHDYDARRILLHKYAHESNCKADRWFVRLVMKPFAAFFGCGYLPGRALATVLAWWLIGWGLTTFAMTKPDILVRSASGVEIVRSLVEQDRQPTKPGFNVLSDHLVDGEIDYGVHPKVPTRDIRCHDIESGLYALDTMLPVVGLHMEGKCEVAADRPLLRWLKAVYAMLGWLIVTLAALTWSGVLRREGT